MPNKAINEFNTVQSLNDNDIFLINQNDTTSTVRLSTIKNTINSDVLPSGTDGQVLTYDGSTNHWVASSFSVNVDNNFTGTNQLLSSNGYQEFPGGLIIQWGKHTTSNSRSVKFPIPFTNSVYSIVVTPIAGDGKRSAGMSSTVSLSGFLYRSGEGGTGDQWYPVYWQAFGN